MLLKIKSIFFIVCISTLFIFFGCAGKEEPTVPLTEGEEIEKLYLENEEFLLDFIVKISKFILNKFEVNIPIYRTSELIELGYDVSGNKSELIINMCKPSDKILI